MLLSVMLRSEQSSSCDNYDIAFLYPCRNTSERENESVSELSTMLGKCVDLQLTGVHIVHPCSY